MINWEFQIGRKGGGAITADIHVSCSELIGSYGRFDIK